MLKVSTIAAAWIGSFISVAQQAGYGRTARDPIAGRVSAEKPYLTAFPAAAQGILTPRRKAAKKHSFVPIVSCETLHQRVTAHSAKLALRITGG